MTEAPQKRQNLTPSSQLMKLPSVHSLLCSAFAALTCVAKFAFTVAPASINATTVPEPSSAMLALLSLPLFLRRRRVKATA